MIIGRLPRRGRRSGSGGNIRRENPLHISAKILATIIATLMATLKKSFGNYIQS
jgi:hypothetical protein